ncbi:MAG: hypothetical protein AAFX50_24000, partial [Acidobacteriota bacterium]
MYLRLFMGLVLLAGSASADTVIPISTSGELSTLLGNGAGGADDGSVIELAAGTYVAPTNGFLALNP